MSIQWSFLPFTVADGPSKGLASAFPVLKQEVQVTKALVLCVSYILEKIIYKIKTKGYKITLSIVISSKGVKVILTDY